MSKEYDFQTWKEVQESEVEHWWNELNFLKNVANVEDFVANWNDVADKVEGNTDGKNVMEEFDYDPEAWKNEILDQIKPYFESWLKSLAKDEDIDYSDYINTFWGSNDPHDEDILKK